MMADESGISYQATLPLSWQKMDHVSATELEAWMHANAVLLRALAMLDTHFLSEADKIAGDAHGKLMERLEAKVDMGLYLLSQLLSQQTPLPASLPTLLSALNLDWWTDDHPPEAGSMIVATLYLSPILPQALTLPLTVLSVAQTEGGFKVHASLSHLSEEVQDWLERTLFRYHRRAIQQLQAG